MSLVYKTPVAATLLVLLVLCISSPVTFVSVAFPDEESIINIDVCNSGKAHLAGCCLPAAIRKDAATLFPVISAFDRPASSFICLSVAPAIAEPPPR